MILERAVLIVKPELNKQFEADFKIANKYVLLKEWKNLLHHYYESFPIVAHFKSIFEHKN